ncbi:MAG: HAMP domain-containing histidine kinase [Bacteroidota bacterium]|nr:HAMP domain-containing histidine kinase [Bacteroidota bacterium]
MAITILTIAGFQVYWLDKAYEREQRTLEMRTNFLFRETIRTLQAAKLRLDSLANDSAGTSRRIIYSELTEHPRVQVLQREKMAGMMDVLMQRTRDTSLPRMIIRSGDSIRVFRSNISPRQNRIMQFLFDVDALQDSIRVGEIEKAYNARLKEQNLPVVFRVSRIETVDTVPDRRRFNEVTLGFANPITYRLDLEDTFPFILKRMSASIVFSVFLVGVTLLSFMLLYRNLLRQRRLADVKNEFISNITHELKTPIATVSVAIEALRSFSASLDPQKTKEYLDISANELQRLSLLVDKVLKLSMFEKKEIELRYEPLNMQQLVDEVTSSMRLQFEKRKADVSVHTEGDTCLQGDRLHLVSVLFNLLDNALKYSNEYPKIDISLKDSGPYLLLVVADNGIGIAQEYHRRIYDKFFRVPHGNLHNAKGYGLGLSYVSHVVQKHGGTIEVSSEEGLGSRFTITLPKREA